MRERETGQHAGGMSTAGTLPSGRQCSAKEHGTAQLQKRRRCCACLRAKAVLLRHHLAKQLLHLKLATLQQMGGSSRWSPTEGHNSRGL